MSTIPCKIIALTESAGVWLIDRGPLVCTTPPHKLQRPKLTALNYIKWYNLYIIFPDGHVEELYPTYEDAVDKAVKKTATVTQSSHFMGDHIFNPIGVILLCQIQGWDLDENSLEMILGRWELEYAHKHPEVRWAIAQE